VFDKYADKDSYVVVTGGSDGIGLEICHQMAALGYNICMIGRNESKMQKAISEVTAKHANIKTKYVVFDFAQLTTMKDYEDKIGKALLNIDIAMLYLNAGYLQCGGFADVSPHQIEQMVAVNTLQPIYVFKVLID